MTQVIWRPLGREPSFVDPVCGMKPAVACDSGGIRLLCDLVPVISILFLLTSKVADNWARPLGPALLAAAARHDLAVA